MASLSDALAINALKPRNRLALPPLTTNCGTSDGYVADDILGFYRPRANDVGLLIVEAAVVRPDGRLVCGSLGLWDDRSYCRHGTPRRINQGSWRRRCCTDQQCRSPLFAGGR